MASEREKAKEEYLLIREQALKMDKKVRISKILADILYMLCGGVIIAAIVHLFTMWERFEGSEVVVTVAVWAVAFVVVVVLAGVMSRRMLGQKKELHDLQQKMEDLESRYHL